jgi:hypothetical protein
MKAKHALLVLLIAAIIVLHPGCYGSFNLTKSLHEWNGRVGSDWGNEGVFLLLVIIPVYGVTMLVDAIVLNSIEFWSGDNPVNEAYLYDENGAKVARLTRVETEDGGHVLCQLISGEEIAGEFLLMTGDDGVTYKKTADGRVLASARPEADGSIVVRDAATGTVQTYTRETIEQWLLR